MISVIGTAKFKDGQLVIPKQIEAGGKYTYHKGTNTFCISCDGFITSAPKKGCNEPRHKAAWLKKKQPKDQGVEVR